MVKRFQIRFSGRAGRKPASGFTILELLVAMFITSVVAMLAMKSLAGLSDIYLEDIGRTRIQQNLRGAMDIISMNVRQAGEGLDRFFPALTLNSGTLTVRKKILHEVLTVCRDVHAGDDRINISDEHSSTPECLPVNVGPSITSWHDFRSAEGGQYAIYIYDRAAKTGQFVNYTGEGSSYHGDYLTIDRIDRPYPERSSNLYIIEQFAFSHDSGSSTLRLVINGNTSQPQDVAYRITDFDVDLTMQDESTRTALAPADTLGWKDVREVDVTLTGIEAWKSRTMSRTVTGRYFPRNVASE